MRLGADRGLLDPEDKKEPVGLNSLLGNLAEGASEMMGDTLEGIWSFMSNPSEEKVSNANAEEEAIKQLRLNDGMGNDWMYKTKPSDNPNKFFRFFENIPNAASEMYLGSSRMARVPEETIKPVGNLIAGGVLNATGGLLDETVGTEQRATANAFADVVGNTFESWDNFTNVIANNPLDFLGILVGVGYTAKSIAELANNPAIKSSFRNTLQALPDPIDLLANNKMVSQFIPDPRQFAMMWHGSPRNFTKLNNKFMLTGEGNNVKGAGFYMGGRASTSKQYFGETDKQNNTYDTTDFDMFQDEVVRRKREADHGENKSEIVSHMWKDVRDDTATPSQVSYLLETYKDHPDLPKLKEAVKEYKELWADQEFSLMKFDVADEKVATFLDDSKGVYDQPQAVKDLIRQENGAYMDLVEAYKQNVGNKIQQDKILAEIDLIGDFPHPDDGINLYEFFVDRRAEFQPSADMTTHNLEVSKYLHENGVMGRRWGDDLTTKYPDVYDSENYLIFDESTAKMFERNEVPVIPDPMIAQHNLSEEALQKHLESGGIPMPSLATSLVDKPIDAFGEISLLGSSDLVTPSKNNLTYPNDMYSGRAPSDRLVYKNVEGVLDLIDPDKLRFFANVKSLDNPDKLYSGGGINSGMTNREYANDKARRNYGLQDFDTGALERQQAMVDQAIKLGYDPFKYDTYREAINRIDNDLLVKGEQRLTPISTSDIPKDSLLGETVRTMTNPKGYRTPTGKKRADVEYSAELALAQMKKKGGNLPGAEGFTSVGQTRAIASEPFKNLQEMKDKRGLLETTEDMVVQQSATNNDLADYIYDVNVDIRKIMYPDANPQNKIGEIIGKKGVALLIEDVLKKGYLPQTEIQKLDLSPKQVAKIKDLIMTIKTKSQGMKTDYFETKPNRIVEMAEFKGAIIPKETKPRIIELLKKSGIKKILTYGTDAERKALFKKFPELNFIGLAMPTSGLLMNQGEEERTGLLL